MEYDRFLEKNCPNLVSVLRNSGHTYEDIIENPSYCIFGPFYSSKEVENFAKQYDKEIETIIKFVEDFDIDVVEKFNLYTVEDKLYFAIRCLTTELEATSSFIGDSLTKKDNG